MLKLGLEVGNTAPTPVVLASSSLKDLFKSLTANTGELQRTDFAQSNAC